MSTSQNLPPWPRESDRYDIHEIHHAIQQYVAHFSRPILQNSFPSPWIKNPWSSSSEGIIGNYLSIWESALYINWTTRVLTEKWLQVFLLENWYIKWKTKQKPQNYAGFLFPSHTQVSWTKTANSKNIRALFLTNIIISVKLTFLLLGTASMSNWHFFYWKNRIFIYWSPASTCASLCEVLEAGWLREQAKEDVCVWQWVGLELAGVHSDRLVFSGSQIVTVTNLLTE